MGGSGASLAAALTYSKVVFAGAILVWLFNSLANVIRGTGNMAVAGASSPASAVLVLIPLSPCLIFGFGPFPRLGVAGGAVAVLHLLCGRQRRACGLSALGPQRRAPVALRGVRLRWALFRDILRVGAVAALITVSDQSHHRHRDRLRRRVRRPPRSPATAPARGSNIC